MASSTVAAWKECLQQLEQINTLPPGDPRLKGAVERVEALGLDKPQSASPTKTWSKVVVDLQMPRRISAACAEAVRQDPRGPAAAAAVVAFRALVSTAHEQMKAHSGSNASDLSAVREQIERSGLLQQLPALFTAAGSSWQHATHVFIRADDLLFLCALMPELWTEGEACQACQCLVVALPWLPAAMQLINAAVQSFDRLGLPVKDHQQQQPSKEYSNMGVLATLASSCFHASMTLSRILMASRSASRQADNWYERADAAAVLQSSQLLPCLAWASCAAFFAWTADWPTGNSVQSSSSSGGGGGRGNAGTSRVNRGGSRGRGGTSSMGNEGKSSNSSTAEVSLLCWQQASANLAQHITPCQKQLIQLLNVSGHSVMWAAGIVRHTGTNISDIHRDVGRLLIVCTHVNKHQHMAELPQLADQLQQQEHLALLLHSLWLPYASKLGEQPIRDGFWMAAIAHLKAGLEECLTLWCSSRYGEQHWLQVAKVQETTVPQPQQPQLLLPAVLLRDVVPHILHVLSVLLEQPRGVERDVALQEQLEGTQLGYVAALHVLLVYSGLPDSCGTSAASDSGEQDSHQPSAPQPSASAANTGTEQQLAAVQVVRDNMLTMLQVLDSCVRSLAVSAGPAQAAAPSHHATTAAIHVKDAFLCINTILSKLLAVLTSCPSSSSSHNTQQLPPTETSAVYSLASSLLKAGSVFGVLPSTHSLSASDAISESLCWRAVALCIEAVGRSFFGQPAGSRSSSNSSSTTTTAAVSQQPSQDIATILPCLVLWGRLFLMLAQKLSVPQDAAGLAAGQASDAAAIALLGAQMCYNWLSLPSFQQQLSAVGYQSDELLQALQQLVDARDQYIAASGDEESRAQSLVALQQQLTAVGQRLCNVATSAFCNNPACSNVAGPTELSLVARPASTCGGCLVSRYCSTACQHVHGHKPVCKALAAAAAAQAEGAAAGEAGSSQPAVPVVSSQPV